MIPSRFFCRSDNDNNTGAFKAKPSQTFVSLQTKDTRATREGSIDSLGESELKWCHRLLNKRRIFFFFTSTYWFFSRFRNRSNANAGSSGCQQKSNSQGLVWWMHRCAFDQNKLQVKHPSPTARPCWIKRDDGASLPPQGPLGSTESPGGVCEEINRKRSAKATSFGERDEIKYTQTGF